jgi:hypothetical protein
MADQRITELVELSQGAVASGDVLPIVDISASQTKKIAVKSLIQAGFGLADSSTLDIAKINQGSTTKIGTTAIADGAITYAKIQNVSATDKLLGRSSAGSGSVEEISCTSFARTILDDTDAATVRSTIGLGTVATGNTINTALLEDGSVTSNKLASGSVSAVKIADSGVTNAKLAANSVDSVQLVASGVVAGKLATDAVVTINIADSAITGAKIATAAVSGVHIVDGSITQSKLASGSIATAYIADSGVTQVKLAANAVATVNITDGNVTTAKLASGSVTLAKLSLSSGELSGAVITASSIPSGSYASGSIPTAAIADNVITFAKIQQVASGVLLGRASAGSGNVESITLTEAGRALLDDTDAAAQRTTLGLSTMAVQAASGVAITGGTAVLSSGTISYAVINGGIISGITDLAIADGGTGASTASDARTNLGLVIGTNVQAYNAALASIAGLTTASGEIIYTTASNTYATTTITAAGRAILDDADASAQRATLGLGTLATQNGSFSGTSTGTNTGDQTITLSGDVTGTGTGAFAATISNSAVTTVKILDGAITTAKIVDSGVTAAKLADDSAAIVAGSTPTGDGDFIGQQWLNTNTGIEYTWTGSEWLRQSGLSTAVISGDTVYSFTTSYPDTFSASIVPSLNTQVATRFFAGPASGSADAAPTFRAISASDLPKATTTALGVAQAGTGLVTVSGIFNHANSVASGTYYKVSVDEQGHVTAGEASLVSDDIPALPASKITTGTFGSGFIADESIIASKLANYSVSQFGEAPPVADFIGQFFFNPLEKDLYLWDGNVWNPVGISVGEIIFGGTYNASGNTIASVSADGAGIGLSVGQPLPAASTTFNRYYVVVASGGTGTSPAPETVLQPPDILLCNGTAWVELDVSSTYLSQTASNVAFSPAGTIGSTNVQSAIEEVNTECRNLNNVASGILATGYGGTGTNTYTRGDILVGSGTTLIKQAVGTNGQVLTANSAFGGGVHWTTPTVGTVTSVSVNSPLTVVSGSTTPVISIPDASTSARGSVQLTDSTSTTSSSLAATATAVKSAFDLANAALPRAGGTITGEVVIGSAGTLLFEGSTDDAFEIQLAAADATADRIVTLPNVTGTIVTTGDTGTVTNTMLAGSIADTKLSTISTAGKVSNSATTATSANTINAIVARDSSGNFSAGTIDATIDDGTY